MVGVRDAILAHPTLSLAQFIQIILSFFTFTMDASAPTKNQPVPLFVLLCFW
jgi:hypothetical protein